MESKEALLHGQMQEGLLLKLMDSPAVTGALDYKTLCLVTRNEEQQQTELKKRITYLSALKDYDRPQSTVVPQTVLGKLHFKSN